MKPQAFTALFAVLGAAAAHNTHADIAKRQAAAAAGGTVVAGVTVPALASLTFGMPTATTPVGTATATPGASGPVSGAPALPSPAWAFTPGQWPTMDKAIDTTSPQVQEWMKELDGYNIPDLKPTTDGSCVNDTAAAADAASRGWWTCGGYTRDTDIVACPDKMTWGISFDDGPGPYSTNLLKYLAEKSLSATFFVVGSRVIQYPALLINEYMAGHEISVHTWSHPHLTALSNAQIVAELGWTRKAIQDVLGVTPTTMRPPYGDIDDRVRMIALAMGLVPIIWTRTPAGGSFDTFDWQVAGGNVNGLTSYSTFETILGNASTLNTGFIVLAHDLYEITVDMAIGYSLNAALTHTPPFVLESIGKCSKIPATNLYVESNKNASFPFPSPPKSMAGGTSSASNATASGKSKTPQSGASSGGGTGGGTSGALSTSVSMLALLGGAALGSLLL
ncbi:carbohydrate esterase family 4 protein [Mycena belliarum]|uniref:chitin deacetylase n=1 Tax=Mycena belliarum TaxID=1033014 RepID=A0AAD6TST8_9AGAR|nr:carbohydrate esterase family 4 protein [Mycena belliae]